MEQLRPKICDVHESEREGRGQECRANRRKKQFSPDTYRAAEASRHDGNILLLKPYYARCDFSPDAVTEGDTIWCGAVVEHIFFEAGGRSSRRPHEMTEFARVEGEKVWYPGERTLFM
jgi:hypothetical protein